MPACTVRGSKDHKIVTNQSWGVFTGLDILPFFFKSSTSISIKKIKEPIKNIYPIIGYQWIVPDLDKDPDIDLDLVGPQGAYLWSCCTITKSAGDMLRSLMRSWDEADSIACKCFDKSQANRYGDRSWKIWSLLQLFSLLSLLLILSRLVRPRWRYLF